jgi:phage minor structural protein
MYLILDPDLNPAGILDLNGVSGAKFYNDLRSVKNADDQGKVWSDTLTLSVPYGYSETDMMTEGYHLLKYADDGFYYCYRIYNWVDTVVAGTNTKTVQAFNLAIWDFYHEIVDAKTFTNPFSTDLFQYALTQTGWEIGTDDFAGSINGTFEFTAGQTSQYWLDQLISQLNVEIKAYVQLQQGRIVRKCIDIAQGLGEDNGYRLEYAHDLQGLTRTGDDMQFFTKLKIYGGTDSKGNLVTIESVNNGKDYIVDDVANDAYNSGKAYLVGYLVNDAILNPYALLDWGKQQMSKYNHPKYSYQVDVAFLGFMPNLGDHFNVIDLKMRPQLTINARVIQIDESESNPLNNKITIGEFREILSITPSDIWKLQAKAAQQAQNTALAKAWRVDTFTPDGVDFADDTSQKRIIVRVFYGLEDVTCQMTPDKFTWQKINPDGSHDLDWEASMSGIGNIITVGIECSDCTIRCQVEDGLSDPILLAAEENAAYFATLPQTNSSGDVNVSVSRYAQVDNPRGDIYWSQRYYGPKRPSGDPSSVESYSITRTGLDGSFKDQMWIIHGGHGQFGIEYMNNKIYIYSCYLDTASNKWWVTRFPYQANKTLTWGDSSIEKLYSPNSQLPYKTNLDVKNQYILFSVGSTDQAFYICKKSDIESGSFKPLYMMYGKDVDFDGSQQSFQSACLDFPYLYFCSGSSDNHDQKILYCCDVRSKSLVYKLVYSLDKGTINPPAGPEGTYQEPECISYYYDSNNAKWLIQGFAFSSEDVDDQNRINQLFRISEQVRSDA